LIARFNLYAQKGVYTNDKP